MKISSEPRLPLILPLPLPLFVFTSSSVCSRLSYYFSMTCPFTTEPRGQIHLEIHSTLSQTTHCVLSLLGLSLLVLSLGRLPSHVLN